MPNHNIIAAGLTALLLLTSVAAISKDDSPPSLNKAQKLVFLQNHLKDIPKGSRLDYGFTSTTKEANNFTDKIQIVVTDVLDENKRDLEFNFLSGPHHIDFSPAKSYTSNPVIIHFLERDISKMAKDTNGSSGFFRNRIRDSFKNPLKVDPVKIKFNGKELNGTEIVVTPFVANRYADNFKLYVNKRYEFIFSDQLPGGIYRIHTQVPDDKGENVLIDEDMTFRKITPTI